MGHVADAEGDGVGVKGTVGDGQLFGVAGDPVEPAQPAGIKGPVAADIEHFLVDVADRNRPAAPVEKAEGDIAGAAADVQQAHVGLRIELIDKGPLPQPVDAEAHQVIHQVVAFGNAVEDVAHQRRLLRCLYRPETEMGCFR